MSEFVNVLLSREYESADSFSLSQFWTYEEAKYQRSTSCNAHSASDMMKFYKAYTCTYEYPRHTYTYTHSLPDSSFPIRYRQSMLHKHLMHLAD